MDGALKKASNENIIQKFITLGWEVDYVSEGNDTREIDKAIIRAKMNKKPTLIEIKTVLGRGSYHEGSNLVHGKPLSKEDMINLRKKYNIPTNTMEITQNAVKYVRNTINARYKEAYKGWQKYFEALKNNNPSDNLKKILEFIETGEVNIPFNSSNFKIQNNYSEELRESNSKMLNIISERTKFFMGGSADLATSCHTQLLKEIDFSRKERKGRNINFGVREHAMGAILNGITLSGFRTFGSTFLVFADYLKPAIRMSALMNLPVTYIFTHDSINVGQDGPSHEPVEQLAMLRTIPNLTVFRPADINEVIGCWDFILNNKKPVALVLAKDEAHILDGTSGEKTKRGGYIVRKEVQKLDAVLVSTGIDLTTTYLISEELRSKGIDTRLVSMPSLDLFLKESKEYQEEIIPANVKVITLEASATLPWYRIASSNCAIGIDEFGYSGTKDDVLVKMNFDYDSLYKKVLENIKNNK